MYTWPTIHPLWPQDLQTKWAEESLSKFELREFSSLIMSCKKIEGWQLRILHSRARCPAGHVILL